MSSSGVTKSLPCLVGPSEATPGGAIQLTAMDTALASLHMAALFIFDRPMHQAAETIRRALSQALIPYYPVAGRVAATAHGLSIACTGEGVSFVVALASCSLEDARLTDPRPGVAVQDLRPTYAGQYTKDPPLLLMQVTEFTCGGFVIGLTWDHVIADGIGMAQFLHAVGEFARGSSSPSVAPVRLDYCLPDLPLPITSLTKSLVSSAHNDFPSSYITVPMSFIDRVKAEFRRHRKEPCSAFEVFVAAIWRYRARATMCGGQADHDAPTALAFTANVRMHADAKEGYYGNLFTFSVAIAARAEVANGDILDVVRLIKDAKARVPCTFRDGAAYIAGEMGGRLQRASGYDTLYVTSWWNLGFDEVDFGTGGPVRVVGDMERKVVPACILCGRKDRADGVAAMALCLREEHQEVFHAELRRLE